MQLTARIIRQTRTQSIIRILADGVDITDDILARIGGDFIKPSRKGDGIRVWEHNVDSCMRYMAFRLYGGSSPFDGPAAREAYPWTVEEAHK